MDTLSEPVVVADIPSELLTDVKVPSEQITAQSENDRSTEIKLESVMMKSEILNMAPPKEEEISSQCTVDDQAVRAAMRNVDVLIPEKKKPTDTTVSPEIVEISKLEADLLPATQAPAESSLKITQLPETDVFSAPIIVVEPPVEPIGEADDEVPTKPITDFEPLTESIKDDVAAREPITDTEASTPFTQIETPSEPIIEVEDPAEPITEVEAPAEPITEPITG